jgi:hypothetical protein
MITFSMLMRALQSYCSLSSNCSLRQRCQREQAVDACGILQGLVEMETVARPERHTHLG